MNVFDKICVIPAALLGLVLLVLGIVGVFGGCSANFKLPPILGVLPAFFGWGIVRSVWVAWRGPGVKRAPEDPFLVPYDPKMVIDAGNQLDKRLFGDRDEHA